MQTKRLTPEAILAKANQVKDRFSASKGKADQMISDALSECMTVLLMSLQQLLQERSMDDARIQSLEKQLKDAQDKLPKSKKLPKSETPQKK